MSGNPRMTCASEHVDNKQLNFSPAAQFPTWAAQLKLRRLADQSQRRSDLNCGIRGYSAHLHISRLWGRLTNPQAALTALWRSRQSDTMPG